MTANRDIVQFMRWSTIPVARVERKACEATVMFSDARFGEPRPGDRFLRQVTLPVAGESCSGRTKAK
jgi:hypothetical protein